MVRHYYRRRRYANKDKYSVEQTSINTPPINAGWTEVPGREDATVTTYQYSIAVVPPADIQGMRKVKHLEFTIANTGQDTFANLYYAIVYVPLGYSPNNLDIPITGTAIGLYDPNQYVMSCGVLDFNAGPCRVKTPLSRNLNSGDSIYLILCTPNSSATAFYAMVKYAITLQ